MLLFIRCFHMSKLTFDVSFFFLFIWCMVSSFSFVFQPFNLKNNPRFRRDALWTCTVERCLYVHSSRERLVRNLSACELHDFITRDFEFVQWREDFESRVHCIRCQMQHIHSVWLIWYDQKEKEKKRNKKKRNATRSEETQQKEKQATPPRREAGNPCSARAFFLVAPLDTNRRKEAKHQ